MTKRKIITIAVAVLGIGLVFFIGLAVGIVWATHMMLPAVDVFGYGAVSKAEDRALDAYQHGDVAVAIWALEGVAQDLEKILATHRKNPLFSDRDLFLDLMVTHARLEKSFLKTNKMDKQVEHHQAAMRYGNLFLRAIATEQSKPPPTMQQVLSIVERVKGPGE